jgi:hypothetical protein
MRRRSAARDSALTSFGIVVTIWLTILTVVEAPPPVVVISGIAAAAVIVFLYVPTLLSSLSDLREYGPRRRNRNAHHLRLVRGEETDSPPADLPDGVYGFEEIFAVAGFKDGRARVKPESVAPDGHRYPLEVQRWGDETYIVVYVSDEGLRCAGGHESCVLPLWTRRQRDAARVASVAVSRVRGEQTRGDGGQHNPFRLVLELSAS